MPIMLILFSLAGLVAGSVVFWRAWRTRHGTLIHCASCNTNVSITAAGRCPNCRRELNESNIAIGKHRPEWSLMFAGGMAVILSLAMILVATVWMSARLRTTWYSVYDNQAVISDLAEKNGMHLPAARTLVDRMYRHELSKAELDELSQVVARSLTMPEPDMLPRIDPRHVLAAELIWHDVWPPEQVDAYLADRFIITRHEAGRSGDTSVRFVFGPKVIPGLPVRFRLTPVYTCEVISIDGRILETQGPSVAFLANGCYTLRLSEMQPLTVDAQTSVAVRVSVTWYDLTKLPPDLLEVERGEVVAFSADDGQRLGNLRAAILAEKPPLLCTAQYVVSMEAAENWRADFETAGGAPAAAVIDQQPPAVEARGEVGVEPAPETEAEAAPAYIEY